MRPCERCGKPGADNPGVGKCADDFGEKQRHETSHGSRIRLKWTGLPDIRGLGSAIVGGLDGWFHVLTLTRSEAVRRVRIKSRGPMKRSQLLINLISNGKRTRW